MASATLDARDDIHPLTIAITAMGGTLAVTPYMLVRAIEEVWTQRSIGSGGGAGGAPRV